MNRVLTLLLSVILATITSGNINSQRVDSATFKLYPRLSFYSFEKKGEFLLHVPSGKLQSQLSVTITTGEKIIATWNGRPGRKILRIPFVIDFPPTVCRVNAAITLPIGTRAQISCNIRVPDTYIQGQRSKNRQAYRGHYCEQATVLSVWVLLLFSCVSNPS